MEKSRSFSKPTFPSSRLHCWKGITCIRYHKRAPYLRVLSQQFVVHMHYIIYTFCANGLNLARRTKPMFVIRWLRTSEGAPAAHYALSVIFCSSQPPWWFAPYLLAFPTPSGPCDNWNLLNVLQKTTPQITAPHFASFHNHPARYFF